MAQNINKTVIWSDSNTKDCLTTFAEGLACNNFDKRVLYIARKQSNKIWYVMKKDIKKDDDKKINILKFVRVRIVSIDNDNFLSCSCGYVQRMLMPCSHVCCVLEKKQFYLPSLFHIRWYKDFNYYYQRDFGKKMVPETTLALNSLLMVTRSKNYTKLGKYKGIFLQNNVLNYISCKKIDELDDLNLKMHMIEKKRIKKGFVIFNDIELNEIDDTDIDCVAVGIDNTVLESYGGDSQTNEQLSQSRLESVYQSTNKDNNTDTSFFNQAYPIFEEAINSCSTNEQCNAIIKSLKQLHFNNIKDKGLVDTHNMNDDEPNIQLYGENPTRKMKVRRTKFRHERY